MTNGNLENTANHGGFYRLSGFTQRANLWGGKIPQKRKSTPGGIRTPNPRFRRPMLYPVELRMRSSNSNSLLRIVHG